MLSPADAELGPAADDEPPAGIAPPEPLRLGSCAEAEDCCPWLLELRGGGFATAEVTTLDAAVGLFAAVFRLQV